MPKKTSRKRSTSKLHPGRSSARKTCDDWTITDKMLQSYYASHLILDHPEADRNDIWRMLDRIDVAGGLRKRIDRSVFDNTPMKRMEPFVNRYTAAAITGMVRKAGLLEFFIDTQLVKFRTHEKNDSGTLEPESHVHDDLPVIKHLLNELPGLSYKYIEILQNRLKTILVDKGMRTPGGASKGNLKASFGRFLDAIGLKGLYDETQAALGVYLTEIAGKEADEVAKSLASKGAPYVFMWHVTLGLFDEMITKLITGTGIQFPDRICPECRTKISMKAAGVPSARKFRKKLKNN